MSATILVLYPAYSILYGLLTLAGVGASMAGFGKATLESGEKSLEERRKFLQKKMLDSIAEELGNMHGRPSSAAWKRLSAELETFKKSVGAPAGNSAMEDFVSDFQALQRRIREEELDTEQCVKRLAATKRKLSALREKNIASWEKELNRLEAVATSERLNALSASERLVELQGVLLGLEEMERMAGIATDTTIGDLKETRYVFEESSASGGEDETRSRLLSIREIRDLADRIAQMDEIEGEKLRPLLENLTPDTPFPDRLRTLSRQLRTEWGRLRERVTLTTLFREKLETLYSIVQAARSPEGDALARRCELLCGGKYIDRAAFMALYEDICRFAFARTETIADNLFAEKVESALDTMGYELLTDAEPESESTADLLPEQVRFLESPYEGYRVMAKIGRQGTFTARIVRAVASEEEKNNITEYQRQKDVETGKKWCRDFDGFLKHMTEQGLPLDVQLRVEPEDSEVLVVVDKEMADKTAKRKAGKRRQKKTLAEKMRELQ